MKKEIKYLTGESVYDYWRKQGTGPVFEDYADLFQHHPLIHSIGLLNNSSVLIFDHINIRYAYVHEQQEKLTGYKPSQWLENHWEFGKTLIPSEYLEFAFQLSHRLSFEYLYQVPVPLRAKFFFTKDFRFVTKNKGVRHFLQKGMVLKMDESGNIQLTLHIATDITHLKKENTGSLVLTGPNGVSQIYSFDVLTKILTDNGSLTSREKEILDLLHQQMDTKQISGKLNVSPHTVDSHRRNLLRKLNCIDTTALVTYCKLCGILS